VNDRGQTTQLLCEAKSGDTQALNALLSRIGTRLMVLVRLRMGTALRAKMEPEDVAQEVLFRAYANVADFEKQTSRSFFAWLAVITTNTLRDLAAFHHQARRDARKEVKTDASFPQLADRHRGALSQLLLDNRLSQLEKGLGALNPRHREVIILRRFEELSFAEIAERMEGTEDGCRMLYTRALTKLTLIVEHDQPT